MFNSAGKPYSLHASLEIGTQARIPKGFRTKAQGCEERAALGNSPEPRANPERGPERVVALFDPERREPRPQPFQGWVYARVHTQGSSFLATLGWRTQSLRDWNACKLQGKPAHSTRFARYGCGSAALLKCESPHVGSYNLIVPQPGRRRHRKATCAELRSCLSRLPFPGRRSAR